MALDYLDYYGLTRDPFEQEIFVPMAGRGAVLDQAVQLLSFSQMIPVIQGPIGSGKTAMLKAIASQMPGDRNIFMLSCDQFLLQESSLMSALADLFDLHGYAHAPKAVLSFIQEQQGRLVLLVDDYDLLDSSSQMALLALLEHGLVMAITLCQLPNNELAGHEYLPLQLEAMQAKDALNYLNQHFARAGLQQGVPLEPKLIARFNQLSQGLPAKLNSLVSQHLRYQTKKTIKQPWFTSLPKWHVYATLGIVGLVVISFWLQFQRQTQQGAPATDAGQTEELQAQGSGILDALIEQQQLIEDEWQQAEWLNNPRPVAEASESGPQDMAAPERSASAPLAVDQPLLVEPLIAEPQVEDSVASLRERLQQQAQAVNAVAPSPAPSRAVTPSPTVITPSAAANRSPSPAVPIPPSAQVQQLAGFPWLLAVRPTEYTIQLFGTWDLEQARAFEQRLTLSQNRAVVVTQRDGRLWYVVVAGQYVNQQQAQAALANLPANLRQEGAWSRTFRSLGLP